jgi:hypothetical protein
MPKAYALGKTVDVKDDVLPSSMVIFKNHCFAQIFRNGMGT